jgi:hypothetical protein
MSLRDPSALASQLLANAANIMTGTNPSYVMEDFLAYYPNFAGNIDDTILQSFINMANAVVLKARWHALWPYGMANFIAHMATMYLEAVGPMNPTVDQVVTAGGAKGVITSESVGDVSASYDFSRIAEDLRGWGDMTLTKYGQMYASKARLLGKGGLYVQ